jgi:RNA polymerase sigma-70 factor (ECF subfamily)
VTVDSWPDDGRRCVVRAIELEAVTTPSLEEVYRKFFPVIRERCRRVLSSPEEAEDVAQETFIRLWQSGQSTRPPRDTAAWIHRTAVHLSIDRLRRRASRPVVLDEGERQGLAAEPNEVLHHRAVLEMLARRVPPEVLEAGLLHRVDGLTQLEVAHLMGCSERTFRRMLVELDQRLARLKEEVAT